MGAAVLIGLSGWLAHRPAAAAAAPRPDSAVAVDTTIATRADVPLYIEGLGNVIAFYTSKITSRVDGELERVAFTEGQHVKKGDLLAQIDPRPYKAALDQAIGTEAKDEAQLDEAKRDLARYQVLAPHNLTSAQTLDVQTALVAQLTAQLQVDRALIESARTQFDYTTITSPINGRTGIRLVDPGNNIHATDTTGIVMVTQMQPISAVFTLPEDELGRVNEALAAGPVTVTALARDDSTVLDRGTLALVDNQIDPTTATVRLKATFPNTKETLWPGQFVNVRVLLRQQRGVITLPTVAVEHGPAGEFAYVVKADSTVEVRPLHLGPETDGTVVVLDGLQGGEHVVTSNQYRLEPGTRVHVISGYVENAKPPPAAAPSAEVARRVSPAAAAPR
jgi:multidrug efflux system membrane fusion protein